MTLITRIIAGGACVYVGDILLSHDQEPVHPVNIPTGNDINVLMRPSGPPRHIVGTIQKINILDDRLIIAWAGSMEQAKGMCTTLLTAIRGGLDYTEIGSFLRRESFAYRDDVSLLDTALLFEDHKEVIHSANFSYRCERVGVPHFNAHVAGSGSMEFVHLLNQTPDDMRHSDESDRGQKLLSLAIALTGSLTGQDIATGQGLKSGWGGGFEVAFLSARGRFEKIGDTLHVPWELSRAPHGGYMVSMVPRLTKYRYSGDILVVTVLDLQKINAADLAVHVVPPLLQYDEASIDLDTTIYDFTYTSLQCHIRLPDNRHAQLSQFDPVGRGSVKVIADGAKATIQVTNHLFTLIAEKCTEMLGQPVSF